MRIRPARPSRRTAGGLALALILCADAAAARRAPGGEPGSESIVGPTAAAVASARAIEETPDASADDARALRRIVQLRSGSTLRAVVRRGENGWEYKQNGGWIAIPEQAVRGVALEREVLARLRERRAALPDGEVRPRAELADWMMREGLLEEAFDELDSLLLEEPTHPAAREVLLAHARRFAVPTIDAGAEDLHESLQQLIRWAGDRGPCSRELATARLEELDDREGLVEYFATQLFDSAPRRRAFAALALRRLEPGGHPRELISRAVLDASDEVRREASFALASANEPALVIPVLRAMNDSSHPRVRMQAAASLGHMGYAAAVGPMVARLASLQSGSQSEVPHSHIFIGRQFAFVQDFDVEVAQFQAIADPQVNVLIEGQVTDAAVHGVEQKIFVQQEKATIRNSLQRITGEKPGNTSRHWMRWWEERSGSGGGE